MVGEGGDFGFEVAGYHVAEFAEGVADDVGIFGGFVAGHFGGEADGGVCGAVDGGDAAENAGHADHGGLTAVTMGRRSGVGIGRGGEVGSEADAGHHVKDFESGAFQDFFPGGIEWDAFERCEKGHVESTRCLRGAGRRVL